MTHNPLALCRPTYAIGGCALCRLAVRLSLRSTCLSKRLSLSKSSQFPHTLSHLARMFLHSHAHTHRQQNAQTRGAAPPLLCGDYLIRKCHNMLSLSWRSRLAICLCVVKCKCRLQVQTNHARRIIAGLIARTNYARMSLSFTQEWSCKRKWYSIYVKKGTSKTNRTAKRCVCVCMWMSFCVCL